jgi:hypothetical protein
MSAFPGLNETTADAMPADAMPADDRSGWLQALRKWLAPRRAVEYRRHDDPDAVDPRNTMLFYLLPPC